MGKLVFDLDKGNIKFFLSFSSLLAFNKSKQTFLPGTSAKN